MSNGVHASHNQIAGRYKLGNIHKGAATYNQIGGSNLIWQFKSSGITGQGSWKIGHEDKFGTETADIASGQTETFCLEPDTQWSFKQGGWKEAGSNFRISQYSSGKYIRFVAP